jgi:signal transduction histidine kinase/ligand-binding sensor domain-containing protein
MFPLFAILMLAASSLPAAAAPGFEFDIWQTEQGLEQNPVTSVVQTSDGYLWVGTYTGLLRYDGVRVVVFDSGNTPDLHNSRVTSLFEDRHHTLWIGHESGELTRLSGGEFRAERIANWPGGTVEAINADENGDLWLLTNAGSLVRLRDGKSADPPGGPSLSRKVNLCCDGTGKLWLSANGQVARLIGDRLVPFWFDSTNHADFLQSITAARDGGVWVMVNGHLRKWRDDRWAGDLGDCPCTAGFATELLETRSGILLAGTVKDGLYVMRPDNVEPLHLSRTNGLSHDWIRALCEDHEGNIWIGTGAGLDSLRSRKVKMLNPPDLWEGRAVMSFAVRADGEAWIGSEGAGLYNLRNGKWTKFTESSGLANLFVWSVLETSRGELWVGTWGGGLFVKNGERFESQPELTQLTAPVLALHEGRDGTIWIGTTSGLYRYADGRLALIAGKDKISLPDVRTITETPDGALWFGMLGGGLGRYKAGVINQFRKQDGLSSDYILALDPEPDGSLWLGTSDRGLCYLHGGKFSAIGVKQGLPAHIISQIVDDDAGNLWMGSHQGIFRASKADLQRCVAGELASVTCLAYGKAEGLASLNCSGGFQPAACKTPDGKLWFPTAKGMAIIDPANASTNALPPPVVIEEFIVADQPVPVPQAAGSAPVIIPAGKQKFEIRYTALSFTAPDKVRFRHQLIPLEQNWTLKPEAARSTPYSYLRPGNYTFRVMACNNDNVWNTDGASLEFTVSPRVWQTFWFQGAAIGLGAGGIAAGVFGFVRRRERRKLERLERQRALERERARIARDIHDDLGASLTRITLLSQSAQGDIEDRQAVAADVTQIYHTARELTRAMDEIVWAVNPRHDTLDSLVAYLGRFAQHYLSVAGIRCRLDEPPHLPTWTLTAEIRHNVFLAFKEALNNVVKHAGAPEVRVSLELLPAGFVLVIADNGRGFDLDQSRKSGSADGARLSSGNGLTNMQKRLEEVGGRCEWVTAPGEGTRVRLHVSLRHQK